MSSKARSEPAFDGISSPHLFSLKGKLVAVISFVSLSIVILGALIVIPLDLQDIEERIVSDARNSLQKTLADISLVMRYERIDDEMELTSRLRQQDGLLYLILQNDTGDEIFSFLRNRQANVYASSSSLQAGLFENEIITLQSPISSGDSGGMVMIGISADRIAERKKNYLQLASLLIPVLVLLSFIVSSFVQRFIAKPITELATVVGKVALDKDYSRRVYTRQHDEISTLYSGFNNMLSAIEQSQSELRDQKYALDKAAIVSVTDPRGRITYVNDYFSELSGFSKGELLGREHLFLKAGHHPAEFYQAIWDKLEQGKVWHGEILAMTRMEHEVWLSTTIIPFMNRDGDPYQYLSIFFNISERKLMEVALKHEKERAMKANQAKTEFLSSMSHELRTPLNAILGFSQLMVFDENLNEEQVDNIREIEKGGQHLLELINEVLDLAKIEAGRIELSIEKVDLETLLEECQMLSGAIADQRGIFITLPEKYDYTLRADYTRVKQVMLNLLSNAVKYNHDDGLVEILCEPQTGDMLKITVRDNGNGIADEDVENLFEPFNRLGAEYSEIEGTGIGLVITKRLIEMMDGAIGVESKLGEGSSFWFTLPEIIDEADELDTLEHDISVIQFIEGEPEQLLYIEDNPANMRLVSQLIASRTPHSLLTADSPLAGLELAREQVPALILLDINLPDMNGYDVLQQLREDELTRDIPVIAVSANAMPGAEERALEAGFVSYITKPIDMQHLLDTIAGSLHKK